MSLFATPSTAIRGIRRSNREPEPERVPERCSCSCASSQEEVLTALRQLQRQVDSLQQVEPQSRPSTSQTVPKELAVSLSIDF